MPTLTPEQLAFSQEYNLVGVRVVSSFPTADAPTSVSTSGGNSAGMGTIVGTSDTTSTVPKPITTSGNIQSSATTGYNSGTGFFLGYDTDGIPKFFIGQAGSQRVTWDGSALNVVGAQKVSVNLTAAETIANGDAVAACLYQSSPVLFDSKAIKTLSLASHGGSGTVSLTVGANSNRALVVTIVDAGGADHAPNIAVDWNGTSISMTQGSTNYATFAGVLVAPATGTHNLTVVNNESPSTRTISVAVYSVYNVTQTSPLSVTSFAQGAGGTVTNSLTTATDGEVTFGLVAANNGAGFSPTAGNVYADDTQNDIVDGNPQGYSGHSVFSTSYAYGSSMTLAATGIGVNSWGISMVSLKPFNPTVSAVEKTDASTAGQRVNAFIGFAQSAASTGATVEVAVAGIISNLTGVQSGTQYYLSNTQGFLTATPGSVTRKAAIGISNSQILITNLW